MREHIKHTMTIGRKSVRNYSQRQCCSDLLTKILLYLYPASVCCLKLWNVKNSTQLETFSLEMSNLQAAERQTLGGAELR